MRNEVVLEGIITDGRKPFKQENYKDGEEWTLKFTIQLENGSRPVLQARGQIKERIEKELHHGAQVAFKCTYFEREYFWNEKPCVEKLFSVQNFYLSSPVTQPMAAPAAAAATPLAQKQQPKFTGPAQAPAPTQSMFKSGLGDGSDLQENLNILEMPEDIPF